MPTGEHESPLELARQDPGLITWLLADRFGIAVPAYDHARPHTTEVRELVPHTYHADGAVAFHDASDRAVLGAVIEVQRAREISKLRTWKLYVAALEADLRAPAALMVFCPERVGSWYERQLGDQEGSLPLLPFFVTPSRVPLITDPAAASGHPAAAVLSVLMNGSDPCVDQAFPGLAQTLLNLGPERALLYYDVVLAGLPLPARQRWETFMTTIPTGYTFKSEQFRTIAAEAAAAGTAKGMAKGMAEGEARAVLAVLDARGLAIPRGARERILATTDLDLLDTWLRAAANATRLEDVLGDANRS
jgi:hypothetical protein